MRFTMVFFLILPSQPSLLHRAGKSPGFYVCSWNGNPAAAIVQAYCIIAIRSLADTEGCLICPPRPRRLNRLPPHNPPSGIAQLRKTSEINSGSHVDAMNLDDFIFAEHVSTPAGLMSPPPAPLKSEEGSSMSGPLASAIPIKVRRETSSNALVPQSVPHHQRSSNNEFNYVQRHHRKTSIDERRVSQPVLLS